MTYSLSLPDDLNKPSLFEELRPLLDRYHLNVLKQQQLKAKGGKGKVSLNAANKRVEAAMRQIIDGNKN